MCSLTGTKLHTRLKNHHKKIPVEGPLPTSIKGVVSIWGQDHHAPLCTVLVLAVRYTRDPMLRHWVKVLDHKSKMSDRYSVEVLRNECNKALYKYYYHIAMLNIG